jgi:hypothetical protein
VASSKKSVLNQSNLPFFDHVMVFLGPLNVESLKASNHNNYQFFLEGINGFSCPYVLSVLEESQLIAGIGLTTRTAYHFDFLSWLEWILEEREGIHPLLIDQMITACHEAIANGLMWSNLELDSKNRTICPLTYAQHLKDRLAQADLAQRYIVLSIFKEGHRLEIRISVEGKPIIWQANPPDHFRGTSIIQELADHVYFDHNHQTICLVFKID